jgi:hypothetical protein
VIAKGLERRSRSSRRAPCSSPRAEVKTMKLAAPRTRPLLLAVLLAGCALAEEGFDLGGPSLIGTSLRPGVELALKEEIRLAFDEPLAPLEAGEAPVVLVPFALEGPCSHDLGCASGSRCHRGRCQRDRVTAPWLQDLASPPLSASRAAQCARLALRLEPGGRELVATPLFALAPHRLHVLVVGPGLRDLAGNRLRAPRDARVALHEVVATAGPEQGPPQLLLRSPRDGATGLPTNLDRVVVSSTRPLDGASSLSLWLRLPSGQRAASVLLGDSPLCAGRAARTCFALRLAAPLPPLARVELRAGDELRDDAGRAAEPAGDAWPAFATGPVPDHDPPAAEQLVVRVADGCVVVRLRTREASDLRLEPGWTAARAISVGAELHELALAAPQPLDARELALGLSDLAGNRAAIPPHQIDAAPPEQRVAISEVLANPAGPEPAQEFVELVNLAPHAVDLAGWSLDQGDDGIAANLLPAASLAPGQYAVVVGSKYSLAAIADPAPAPGALVVRVKGTLGGGGLLNSGAPIVLRDASGWLVSSYGGHHPTSGSGGSGRSVERTEATACDVRASWRPSEQGASTPGLPPPPPW